jgi:hypothetical protein
MAKPRQSLDECSSPEQAGSNEPQQFKAAARYLKPDLELTFALE